MTIRQLTQVLNEIPAEFMDCEVEFGSQLTDLGGHMMWLDKAITSVYANPDRDDVVLCSKDVGDYLCRQDKFKQHLRLIPIFKNDDLYETERFGYS